MRIPLGVSDFRMLRQEKMDYIDKSLLIRDVIDESSQVVLLPRPRRFGKTLNLSMLRYYLERKKAGDQEDRWALFQGLAIEGAGEEYLRHFQRYPTIHLSFKDIKDTSWERCLANTTRLVAELYKEHEDLLPQLSPLDARDYHALCEGTASQTLLAQSWCWGSWSAWEKTMRCGPTQSRGMDAVMC